jgi:Protein of unknown function (DUF732)
MPALRHFTALVGTAAAASALGLAALVTAGTAGAGSVDDTFMSVLADEGIEAPSTVEAVSAAHGVCMVFDDGLTLVDAVSAVSDVTGLSMESSAFFVGASVATYCPEHEGAIA